MGLLINGEWKDRWYESDEKGAFKREPSQRRDWITADGGPGPDGQRGVKAESGRYHLYVSHACPWAHRTMIYRVLKGLEPHVGMSVVSWRMLEHGWTFDRETGSDGDAVGGHARLYEIYTADDPRYSGRVTVPVLWDRREGRIVNNESSEIIRMLDAGFDDITGSRVVLYPEPLREEIDALNARIYPSVNNGVYRAGFATSQEAYEEAFDAVFAELDALDARLATRRYLTGPFLTEADWRLFTTLVRFDAVYHGHFKCNLRQVREYPHLSGWLRELYQWPGIADTVHFEHIKRHYYESHPTINPTGIVPKGPALTLTLPHGREGLEGRGLWTRPTA